MDKNEELKEYVIRIEEINARTVIIKAGSPEEAEQICDSLCHEGEIDLNYEDFSERKITYRKDLSELSRDLFEVYTADGKES